MDYAPPRHPKAQDAVRFERIWVNGLRYVPTTETFVLDRVSAGGRWRIGKALPAAEYLAGILSKNVPLVTFQRACFVARANGVEELEHSEEGANAFHKWIGGYR